MRHFRVSDLCFCTLLLGRWTIADVNPDEVNRVANLEAKVSRSRKAGGELKRVRAWHDVERMSPKIGACVPHSEI